MSAGPNSNQGELTPLGVTQSTELILHRALLALSAVLKHLGIKFVVTGDYVGYEQGFYKVPRSLIVVLLSDTKGISANVDEVQKNICDLPSDGTNAFSYEQRGRIRFNDILPAEYVTHTSCRITLLGIHKAHVDVQKACSIGRLIVSKKGPWKSTPPILNVLDSLSMFPKDGYLKRDGQKVIQRLRYMIHNVLPGDVRDEIFVSNDHFRSIRRISDHIPEAYSYAPLIKFLDIRPRVAIGHEGTTTHTYELASNTLPTIPLSHNSNGLEDDDDAVLTQLAKKLDISHNSFS